MGSIQEPLPLIDADATEGPAAVAITAAFWLRNAKKVFPPSLVPWVSVWTG